MALQRLKGMRLCAKGFLLIELCASLLLVMLLMGTLSVWYIHFHDHQSMVTKRVTALLYATSLLEYMRNRKVMPRHKLEGFKASWTIVPDKMVAEFKTVTLRVSWQEKGRTHLVQLKTGMV